MAQGIQTSFIPKRVEERRARPPVSVGSILSAASLVVLVLCVASAVAVFFYKRFVEASLERKEARLVAERDSFDSAVIEELIRLDERIVESNTLLATHIVPTRIFDALESITLQTVQFEGFDFSMNGEGVLEMVLQGRAASFNAVAVQVEAFERAAMFVNPVFSNLAVSSEGDVTFTVHTELDMTALVFKVAAPTDIISDEVIMPEVVDPALEGVGQPVGTFGTGTPPALGI